MPEGEVFIPSGIVLEEIKKNRRHNLIFGLIFISVALGFGYKLFNYRNTVEVVLTVAFVALASIETFTKRITQSQARGEIPNMSVLAWYSSLCFWLHKVAMIGLLWTNWKWALIVIFCIFFVAATTSVLDRIGCILSEMFIQRLDISSIPDSERNRVTTVKTSFLTY